MESKTRRDLIVLAVVGIVFFFSTLVLVGLSPTFSSPDEMANAFFTKVFVGQGHLYSSEPFNVILGDVLFPRSMISIEGRLVPIGFLGLPLIFGSLIKIFGFWSLAFWTPFFAVLAMLAWYATIRRLFSQQVALFSAIILMAHPAWWYWSSRSLMPNVVFVCFLIFFGFFLVVRPFRFIKKELGWLDFVLSGFYLAVSVWFRSFEILWLAPLLIIGAIVFRKFFSWKSAVLFLVSFVVAMLPFLYFNNSLYGAPWKTGYNIKSSISVEPSEVESLIESSSALPIEVSELVLPFGLHPRTAAKHVLNYGLLMFWWLTIPAAVGFVLLLRKDKKNRLRNWLYAGGFIYSAIWFGIIYGSWTINDNPDLSAVTIVNSYTRYWLPVFVLSTPIIALALAKLGVLKKRFGQAFVVLVFLIMVGLSFNSVFLSSEDALWPMRSRLVEAASTHNRVLELTESNSVIVVDRADKLFFPDRQVRYPLRDEITYALMPRIAERVSLYYFGITFPEVDMEYLNNDKLNVLGLQIDFIQNFGEESLYQITKAE